MLFQSLYKNLFERLDGEALLQRLRPGKGLWIHGLWGASRAFLAAALLSKARRPAILICSDEAAALELYDELRFFLQGFPSLSQPGQEAGFSVKYPTILDPGSDPLVFFSALEFGAVDSVNREHGRNIERLLVLRRLAAGEPLLVVSSLPALLQRQLPPEVLIGSQLHLRCGKPYKMEELIAALLQLGYRREAMVEEPGQFSVRGGILDIAAPNAEHPLRAEFDGDILESLREFDSESQKSLSSLESFEVMPFHELILSEESREEGLKRVAEVRLKPEARRRWMDQLKEQTSFGGQDWLLPFFYPEASLFDYFDCLKEKPLLLLEQPQQWKDASEQLRSQAGDIARRRHDMGLLFPEPEDLIMGWPAFLSKLRSYPLLASSLLLHSISEFKDLETRALTFKSLNLNPGDVGMLYNELIVWMGQGHKVLLACSSHGDLLRLQGLFEERKLSCKEILDAPSLEALEVGEIGLLLAKLERGFLAPDLGLVLLSEQEIFKRPSLKAPRAYRHRYQGLKGARKIESFSELKEGQAAVHIKHGIGIFRGVVRMNIEGFDKDFVALEYAEHEKLYVPVDQVNLVQKYLGGEETPRLHKLGSASWASAQERVKKSVAELAEELLKIYASRQMAKSQGFGPDTKWQQEFEESFPFEETEDQLKAIEACKRDLEGQKPMDRLICGDVGFGKTEVALRACFKTVMSGHQAAILVPTTILCQQHFATFSERLQDFPVRLGMLSRFRSVKEQKQVVQGLKDGSIDLVVGTHRLLSQDIEFKKLGLIVVDEEQRFGVAHKERLKKMRAQTGVLTMSATPVPRTLHFSLSGMRDMSMIETPPLDRLPVRTYVLEENPEIMREAILGELARQGQIFFVHNRVKDIEKVAQRLRELVPESSVAVGHGQMPKHDLEKVMLEFLGRQHDILVATTIIESGLDIPNVNTIIINHAEDYGLSQLYQLRGRVGRSERQAYAYLFYPRAKSLPEVAEKRLAAMEEFTELGAGFKVAMRDMEIRGVGNILGPQQHGHVAAVGFDLYVHLLNEAVAKLKGEDIEEDRTPSLNLEMDAYIPENYISDPRQKMDAYKRLAALETSAELKQMEEELKDRYGDLPQALRSLLEAVEIRIIAKEIGLSEIVCRPSQIVLRYYEDRMPGEDFVSEMMLRFKDKIRFLPGPPPGLTLNTALGQSAQVLRSLLPQLKRYVKITQGS